MEMIKANKWKDSSRRLFNPGKRYFWRLATHCVCEVNEQRDDHGVNYGRMAMNIIGMALNTNRKWEVKQLTPDLQRLVVKHQSVFDAAWVAVLQQK